MPQSASQILSNEIVKIARSGSEKTAILLAGVSSFTSSWPTSEPDLGPMLRNFVDPQRRVSPKFEINSATGARADTYYAAPPLLQSQFEQLREKVAAFGHLPHNWDSYGAAPIGSVAVFRAFMLLTQLEQKNLCPDVILPTSDESILIRFTNKEQVIQEWEFFSDGQIGKLVIDAAGNHAYSDVPIDELRHELNN